MLAVHHVAYMVYNETKAINYGWVRRCWLFIIFLS